MNIIKFLCVISLLSLNCFNVYGSDPFGITLGVGVVIGIARHVAITEINKSIDGVLDQSESVISSFDLKDDEQAIEAGIMNNLTKLAVPGTCQLDASFYDKVASMQNSMKASHDQAKNNINILRYIECSQKAHPYDEIDAKLKKHANDVVKIGEYFNHHAPYIKSHVIMNRYQDLLKEHTLSAHHDQDSLSSLDKKNELVVNIQKKSSLQGYVHHAQEDIQTFETLLSGKDTNDIAKKYPNLAQKINDYKKVMAKSIDVIKNHVDYKKD
jgi:hypothetical protein